MENILRILNRELAKENVGLNTFKKCIDSSDVIDQRYGNGNINSCEFRIKELEKTMLFLKQIHSIKSEKRLQDLQLTFESKTFNI